MDDLLSSNIPEFSVSEISQALKTIVENNFSFIRVRGELSRITIAKSGHLYSSIKDENSVLDAICWKGTMNQLSLVPQEGMEVVVTGRLTTYPGRSNYQIIIEKMELAGEGALLKMLEERRKKLAGEGLFDEQNKKTLPFCPRSIGVVTSPTGAVIKDILHRVEDRFPVPVLLWPVIVQGKTAAEQIATAIDGFNKLSAQQRPDVLIVARGGGSLEDLMPFQEEIVVRAIAKSIIPIISAIGHETDTTLADFASDLRAPTPSAAAEKAVPVRRDILAWLETQQSAITHHLRKKIVQAKSNVISAGRGLTHPKKYIELLTQRLDYAQTNLIQMMQSRIEKTQTRYTQISNRIVSPHHKIDLARGKIESMHKLLESLSFKSVLARGYAVIRDENNKPLLDQKSLPQSFIVEMRDGIQKARKE